MKKKDFSYYFQLLNRKEFKQDFTKNSFIYKYIMMKDISKHQNSKEIESFIEKIFFDYKMKLSYSKFYPVQDIKSCRECTFYLYTNFSISERYFNYMKSCSVCKYREFLNYEYGKMNTIFGENKKHKIRIEIHNGNYNKLNYCSYCFLFLHPSQFSIFSYVDHLNAINKYFKVTHNIVEYNNSNKFKIDQNLTNLLSNNFINLAKAYLSYDHNFNKSKYFIAPLLNDYYVHNTFLYIDNITYNLPHEICLVYKEKEFKKSPVYNLLTCDGVRTFTFKPDYLGVILPVSYINNFAMLFKRILHFENGNLYSRYSKLSEKLKNKILSFYFPHKILFAVMNSILNVTNEDIFLLSLLKDLNEEEIGIIEKIGEIFTAIDCEKELIKINS